MKFSTGLVLSTLTFSAFGQLNSNLASSAVDKCCTPDMGLLVLALQWIPGLGPRDAFTVHGLWPNNCDGTYGSAEGCDTSRNYNDLDAIVGADSSLESDMNTYWASYKGDNPAFWEHEWSKHGTCYSVFAPNCYSSYSKGQDARDYFKTGLKLRSEFNLYQTLKSSGIVPGGSYPRNDFIAALNKLGAQVQLICKSGAINEIRLHMYVTGKDNFQITNSPAMGSCPKTIRYPIKN
ncbi:base non specific RNase Rh [Neoconidiobolus thromboides FSU 785]|nr:base non specific RNase Rh [Neoconidiobolus thromboides FSU 785]